MSSPPITAVPLHEDDLIRRGSANGFTLTEAWSPPRRIPVHAHASLSITIMLGGAFEERYRATNLSHNGPHTCEPGSLLIRPAGEIHENRPGREGARTLSVELTPARLELSAKTLAPLLSLGLQRERAFLDLGLAMSRELRHADAATPLALESLTLELLARLVRMEAAAGTEAPPQWLVRARDSIHARYREQSLRVAHLAAEQGVHPVYFARAFRRHFQLSPGEYVRRLRVEAAWTSVRESPDSLVSIAHASGFADQSHMHRAFRRRFSASPGQLRRKA